MEIIKAGGILFGVDNKASITRWKYSKKDNRFYTQNTGGDIVENSWEISDNQTYKHVFTHLKTGKTAELTSHCGYDRGPRLQSILFKLHGLK